jgi:hypothetical protein
VRRASSLAAVSVVAVAVAAPRVARADCTPDLKPTIASPIRTIQRPFQHRARERIAVRIDNATPCDATGRIGIKPLLLPAADVVPHGDHTHPAGDGVVLPTTFADIDIPGGEGRVVTVGARLPPLQTQTWRLTAIVDSTQAIAETDELNGVADLVSAGYFGVERGNPTETGVDFTSSIRGALAKQAGGVADTLGLHSRPQPSFALDSRDVGTRFLLADVKTGKIYTLMYSYAKPCAPDCDDGLTCDIAQGVCVDAGGQPVPEIDKQYYAIGWAPDLDDLGRNIVTDIYWQAPRFTYADGAPFVPPGNYRFLTVMDEWDRVPEYDESNNVDSVPFTLAPLEIVGFPNTWFVSTPIAPQPPDVTAMLLDSYSAALDFTVDVPAGATWLHVTPASGNLDIDQQTPLAFSVDRTGLSPGVYHADVTITAAGFPAFPVVVPVAFYVYATDVPAISIAPDTLDFQTSVGVHPPPQDVTLSNPGNLPLDWEAWPEVPWISVSPNNGSGPAGYSEQVALIIHPEGMQPGGPYVGKVQVFSSAPDGGRELTARLVVAPCEQGFCDQGWTCNLDSHFCEPPQACTTHDECPTGQDCSPDGFCESTGPCSTDLDCQWVWSPYGALSCDQTRGTCELASCTADVDCPVGSYCNEATSLCPVSQTCTADDQCFGSPFAYACDLTRTTCVPATCAVDADCPAASYCSTFWSQCVATQHCAADIDCYALGMQCDEPRDACRP